MCEESCVITARYQLWVAIPLGVELKQQNNNSKFIELRSVAKHQQNLKYPIARKVAPISVGSNKQKKITEEN